MKTRIARYLLPDLSSTTRSEWRHLHRWWPMVTSRQGRWRGPSRSFTLCKLSLNWRKFLCFRFASLPRPPPRRDSGLTSSITALSSGQHWNCLFPFDPQTYISLPFNFGCNLLGINHSVWNDYSLLTTVPDGYIFVFNIWHYVSSVNPSEGLWRRANVRIVNFYELVSYGGHLTVRAW